MPFRLNFPSAKSIDVAEGSGGDALPGAGYFIQEFAPETAGALVDRFIQMTP